MIWFKRVFFWLFGRDDLIRPRHAHTPDICSIEAHRRVPHRTPFFLSWSRRWVLAWWKGSDWTSAHVSLVCISPFLLLVQTDTMIILYFAMGYVCCGNNNENDNKNKAEKTMVGHILVDNIFFALSYSLMMAFYKKSRKWGRKRKGKRKGGGGKEDLQASWTDVSASRHGDDHQVPEKSISFLFTPKN